MSTKDPYAALGVARDATQEQIKSAYRALAKKLHPDLNPGNKEAEARFKEVSQAYELLGDAERRKKYDRGETDEQMQEKMREEMRRARGHGQRASRSGPFYYETQADGGRYSGEFDFEDLMAGLDGANRDAFESILRGQRGGQRGGQARRGPQPGRDEIYRLAISLEDAANGAERELTLPSGKRLHVKIPAGIDTGTKLRFAGQGGPGSEGAPAGDAYVEIEVEAHAQFKRGGAQNRDIEVEVPVDFAQAMLGGEVTVPTLSGPVALRIPPGVSTGSKLRIRGKGMLDRATSARGDQIVKLAIRMPAASEVDPELRAAVRRWAERTGALKAGKGTDNAA